VAGGEIDLPWPARAWPVRTVVAPPIG
jgi:hypothetical protein